MTILDFHSINQGYYNEIITLIIFVEFALLQLIELSQSTANENDKTPIQYDQFDYG